MMARNSKNNAEIFIGPAGWSYADWKEVVYPPRLRGTPQLAYLARFFNCVEVNSSFYRIPHPRQCEQWVHTVSAFENFQFTVKLWQEFTHVRESIDAKHMNAWHLAMQPLRRADRLGCVLVQFPWSFKCTAENTQYLKQLTLALSPDRLAIEMRHDSWNNPEFTGWLTASDYIFCNIDQPLLPRCLPPTEHVTAAVAYVRLHGRNAAAWFQEDADVLERYRYLYSKAEIAEWVIRLRRLIESAERVFVITNNHTGGRAVANAVEIKSLLLDKKVEAPPYLLRRYPEVAEFSRTPAIGPADSGESEQLTLF